MKYYKYRWWFSRVTQTSVIIWNSKRRGNCKFSTSDNYSSSRAFISELYSVSLFLCFSSLLDCWISFRIRLWDVVYGNCVYVDYRYWYLFLICFFMTVITGRQFMFVDFGAVFLFSSGGKQCDFINKTASFEVILDVLFKRLLLQSWLLVEKVTHIERKLMPFLALRCFISFSGRTWRKNWDVRDVYLPFIWI